MYSNRTFVLVVVLVFIGNHCLAAQESAKEKVHFGRQIQPLLARDCYACHGPDKKTRAAGLRLDTEAAAKEFAIVAGEADSSELIDRIFSDDPEIIMPPPETGHRLTIEEKNLIKRWIEEGADWQKHWAFEPIPSPRVPAVDSAHADWPRNEIDRFVLAVQREKKLSPSAAANPATLLRRVYLDLIGLPPTPEQLAAFLKDPSPRAFESVVDDLLNSPQYGEQMAVQWLDAARYADTNGYQNDFVRNMWPWRDWVIDAFNKNLPYDQFIVQQLAGDLLPNPTKDQLIATGFNRNNRTVTEGGSIEEEWRVENCIDRTETTAGAFLGLTMGCARCHDHKYDPISQREFYEFYAFFNNVADKGFYNEARGNVGPTVSVVSPERQRQLADLTRRIEDLKQQIQASEPNVAEMAKTFESWRSDRLSNEKHNPPNPAFRFTGVKTKLPTCNSPAGKGWKFSGVADAFACEPPRFKFAADQPFSWSVWVKAGSRGVIFGKMDEENGYRGTDGIILADGKLKVHLIHHWKSNAIAVISQKPLPTVGWTCISVTYDGSQKAGGIKIYFNGQPVETVIDADSLRGAIETSVPFKIGQRNKSELLNGSLARLKWYDRECTGEEVQWLLETELLAAWDALGKAIDADAKTKNLKSIANYFLQWQQADKIDEITRLKAEFEKLQKSQPTTMVMRDRPKYRKTYLLKRGQYDQPDLKRGALFPAIPSALPPLAKGQPKNRMGLAQWMVDHRNPLVARVAVNRAWMKFFGRGIVHPADNFGIQGTPPTHPVLLDWLADDFRKNGWDLKRLHKMIVLSATYQQASVQTPQSLASDPENLWLARGPRYRLSAEQIRDQALAVSGLLTTKIGGPSVFPYQPDGLWEELAGGASNGPYVQSKGDDLYRRSLYTYRKRTVSHPTLSTFGAPSWEICQLYRTRTNTPLQALALLNDVTYVEASRKLAERMLVEPSSGAPQSDFDPTESIKHGIWLTHLREPRDAELNTLLAGFGKYLKYFEAHPGDARQLIAAGDSKPNETLPVDRLAAMTSVATVLLNRDEVITKE